MSEQHPSVPQVCFICREHCPFERVVICEGNGVFIPLTLCCACHDTKFPDPIDKLTANAVQPCEECLLRVEQNRNGCDKTCDKARGKACNKARGKARGKAYDK